ncbi:MAG: hypothetical protein J0L92_21350 [Deltaproteobacteria bacterium]|nr:hypothetical protein [Deltaproteobacteria bacterium]
MLRVLVCSCALGSLLTSCGSPPPPVPADAGRDAGPPAEGTYENVVEIMRLSCAFASCHGGSGAGAAMLNLERAIAMDTVRETLVEQPACMYDAMSLVTPGDPEASWLYVKVAGSHTGPRLDFTPAEDWDPGITPDAMGNYPASTCPLTERGDLSFGAMMPQGSGGLDASRAETIRLWIEAGAPGPAT